MANREKDRAHLLDDAEVVREALAKGIRTALEQHRRAGNDVALWRDGRVVRAGPDEIAQLLEARSERDPDAEKLPEC